MTDKNGKNYDVSHDIKNIHSLHRDAGDRAIHCNIDIFK